MYTVSLIANKIHQIYSIVIKEIFIGFDFNAMKMLPKI